MEIMDSAEEHSVGWWGAKPAGADGGASRGCKGRTMALKGRGVWRGHGGEEKKIFVKSYSFSVEGNVKL